MSYELKPRMEGDGFWTMGTAGEDLGARKLVYLDTSGQWILADSDAVSTMPATGISCGVIQSDGTGEILFLGLISSTGWSWVTGGVDGLLYPSTNAGELTQSKPLVSGDQVQIVATVITENLILFNPNYVLVEVS